MAAEGRGEAVKIFQNNFSDSVPSAIRKNFGNVENFTCFAEYYGFNSFAGNHVEDDKKCVKIFDISLYKRGFITPKEFQALLLKDNAPSFEGIYTYNKELISNIQNWKIEKQDGIDVVSLDKNTVIIPPRSQNIVEGFVCKGIQKRKGQTQVWMAKVKTLEWLNKVKQQYGQDYLLKELNGDKLLLV